jgi:hypothetical protein
MHYTAAPQSPGFPKKASPFFSFPGSTCRKSRFSFCQSHPRHLWVFFPPDKNTFTGWGCLSHTQLPTWTTSVSFCFWIINFHPSGVGDPANFHRYSSQDPLTTPVPPLRQNKDIIVGSTRISSSKVRIFKVPLYPATYFKYSHKLSCCDVWFPNGRYFYQ